MSSDSCVLAIQVQETKEGLRAGYPALSPLCVRNLR